MVLPTTFALAQRHEREMNITREGNGHRKNCLERAMSLGARCPRVATLRVVTEWYASGMRVVTEWYAKRQGKNKIPKNRYCTGQKIAVPLQRIL